MNILELLDHPIAYHRIFARLTGSVQAALMLSQAVYWQNRTTSEDGWWWKGTEQWTDETGLTRYEQETARRMLRKLLFWKEKRRGVPAKMYYLVDGEALRKSLENLSLLDSSNQDRGKPANKIAGNQRTCSGKSSNLLTEHRLHTEITTETTTTTAPAGGGGGGFENLHFPNCLSTPQRQAGALKKLAGLDAESAQSLLDAVAWQAGNGGFKTRDGRPGTALRFLEFLRREFDAGRFEESGAIEIRERRAAARGSVPAPVPAHSAPRWDNLPESLKPARLRGKKS